MFPLMAAYRFFIEAIVLLVTMATGRCGLARCYGSGLSSHGYNAEDRGVRDHAPAQWLAPPAPWVKTLEHRPGTEDPSTVEINCRNRCFR